jgi:hypothetical protein
VTRTLCSPWRARFPFPGCDGSLLSLQFSRKRSKEKKQKENEREEPPLFPSDSLDLVTCSPFPGKADTHIASCAPWEPLPLAPNEIASFSIVL